jgi:hypothetical protein
VVRQNNARSDALRVLNWVLEGPVYELRDAEIDIVVAGCGCGCQRDALIDVDVTVKDSFNNNLNNNNDRCRRWIRHRAKLIT